MAWITLDERDSDLGLFLRYFISGVQTMFPGACADTFGLVQATRQPAFELLCTTFINEIAAIPQDFILVLDDCHLISGTDVPDLLSELHAALAAAAAPGADFALHARAGADHSAAPRGS